MQETVEGGQREEETKWGLRDVKKKRIEVISLEDKEQDGNVDKER